jgi:hypothetical protein
LSLPMNNWLKRRDKGNFGIMELAAIPWYQDVTPTWQLCSVVASIVYSIEILIGRTVACNHAHFASSSCELTIKALALKLYHLPMVISGVFRLTTDSWWS